MSINEPKFETPETTEQKLLRLLKDKTLTAPETLTAFNQWLSEQEKLVEQADDYVLAQIELNLKRARLYLSAGYIDEALADFEDARCQAWNEQRDELYGEIMREMDGVEKA